MSAGYSGTPLAKKLGIKPGSHVHLRNAPKNYSSLLAPLPDGVSFVRQADRADIIHVFTSSRSELASQLKELRAAIGDEAAVWVSWPKRASKLPTDITEDVIRAECLPLGFVDIKVCAVDETWSGLKLVIRKELRGEGKREAAAKKKSRE
jgi:hypothetical protein